jgi:hypothetical protein
MGMVFGIVVDPTRQLLQDSERIWTRLDPRLIAFKGFDEGLADTVASQAVNRGAKDR